MRPGPEPPGEAGGADGPSSLAAGAAAVSPPLGASPEVAQVILDRFLAARTDRRAPAAAMPEAKISVDDPLIAAE